MSPDEREFEPRFFNRELSWLDFNRRVLALAEEPNRPLLDRLRFVSIWSQNLDEFFQVRVAGLRRELKDGRGRRSPDGRTTREQLAVVRERVLNQSATAIHVFEGLRSELFTADVRLEDWQDLDIDEQKQLSEVFDERVFPVLTPLAVDTGHPFPYLSTLSLSLGVLLIDPRTGLRHFARLKVPHDLLGRTLRVGDANRFVPLEQVIAANLAELFPGMQIAGSATFRVTRDADLSLDDFDGDLITAVEQELQQRRFGSIVRLEVEEGASDEMRRLLVEEMGLSVDDLYETPGPIDLGSLGTPKVSDRPDLVEEAWDPVTPSWLRDEESSPDLFSLMRQRDMLVHHPYVSFESTVLELIRRAASDPAVQAIKMTMYRTSGDSRIVDSLIRAAEAGKQVVVVVELKARFDEEANIAWARRLERAGVHVAYGFPGIKVHSKVLLVVRVENDGVRRYCHLGTGNYNSRTARIYSDVGLLTSNQSIGDDLSRLFNQLTGYAVQTEFEHLIVAPDHMRSRLTELIRNEARHGAQGRIVAKMNSLVDPDLIEELYAASNAGVPIDLIVRGICSLRPGVPGLSENIRVRSILGRYLEHARVYHFGNGIADGHPMYLIGSADLMPRNLNRRVEVLVPIHDLDLQGEVEVLLGVNLADDVLAWELGATGEWNRVLGAGQCDTHRRLQELTR